VLYLKHQISPVLIICFLNVCKTGTARLNNNKIIIIIIQLIIIIIIIIIIIKILIIIIIIFLKKCHDYIC